MCKLKFPRKCCIRTTVKDKIISLKIIYPRIAQKAFAKM